MTGRADSPGVTDTSNSPVSTGRPPPAPTHETLARRSTIDNEFPVRTIPLVHPTTKSATSPTLSPSEERRRVAPVRDRDHLAAPTSILQPHTSPKSDQLLPISPNSDVKSNLAAFPSLQDLQEGHHALFNLIASKEYLAVEKFLLERGHTVNITPKLGCSPLHYSNFNVANWENERGDSPLIQAAKVDAHMVVLVLKYGGNPNHTNVDRDSPLSIAAVRGDRDSIDELLHAGANLQAAVIKLTSSLRLQSAVKQAETGFSVKSLTFLLSDDVYLKCRDPIIAAFNISENIVEIIDAREEFRTEFELLMVDSDIFAFKLLDHCEKMWEAREVLSREQGLIKRAIEDRKMRFLSHPFSQQVVMEEWYGECAYKLTFGKLYLALKYLLSPLLLTLFYFQFVCSCRRTGPSLMSSRFAIHMKLLFTPFMCYVTDMINYLFLLGLLVSVCLIPMGTVQPHQVEWALWLCTVSRILIELDQMAQQNFLKYFLNFWNIDELLVCLVITAAALYRIILWQQFDPATDSLVDQRDQILHITYLYSFAELLLILRWLNVLEVSTSLGPLLIALRYLFMDVFRFVVLILLTCVLGATIAVHAITANIRAMEDLDKTVVESNVPPYFSNFVMTFKSITWSTFGLLEMPDIKITGDETSTMVIHVILVVYIVLACVMMLNMLIAMLNNTYERIQDNCDMEWKFARSALLKEYRNGQPFLFPFHFILIPFTMWFRPKLEKDRQLQARRSEHIADSTIKREDERNVLLNVLCERYARSRGLHVQSDPSEYDYGRRDTHNSGSFAEQAAISRHRSFMRGDSKSRLLGGNETTVTRGRRRVARGDKQATNC